MTLATVFATAVSADVTPTPISAVDSTGSVWSVIVGLVFYVLIAVALWKVFAKAGRPGILALIPIVNAVILLRIVGLSGWLVLLYIIPIVNLILAIVVALKLGAAFGKGGVFSFFLLWLFSFIGYFILGFGDAKYTKPVTA